NRPVEPATAGPECACACQGQQSHPLQTKRSNDNPANRGQPATDCQPVTDSKQPPAPGGRYDSVKTATERCDPSDATPVSSQVRSAHNGAGPATWCWQVRTATVAWRPAHDRGHDCPP